MQFFFYKIKNNNIIFNQDLSFSNKLVEITLIQFTQIKLANDYALGSFLCL